MLKINNLTVSVNNKIILKDFNMEIKDSEVVALMGPNGVGKSTICKVIMGDPNYIVESGSITYNDEDLLNMDVVNRSKKGIYLVNQNPIEVEGVTNADLLRSAVEERSNERVNIFKFNKELTNICDELDIPKSFIHRDVNVGMSGGERKKNEILHLYMLKPNFIMLDELDSGLDVDNLRELSLALINYLKEDKKRSCLIVTHHTNILEYIKPDKVNILMDKHIVETGDYSLAKKIEATGFKGEENDIK